MYTNVGAKVKALAKVICLLGIIGSVIMVDVLEKDGEGLNLTWEVRDGIRNHSGEDEPATLEGWCVRRADRIAYINHDIDDAIRGGILKPFELPQRCLTVLGDTHSKRINTMLPTTCHMMILKPERSA